MKSLKKLAAITAAMQPGQITRDGFLGNDPRSLAEILADDQAAVDHLGLSHRQIARRMIEFREAGQKACGDWTVIPPHWEARVDFARGRLPCPFGDAGLYPKTSITVRNIQNGMEITFTDLHIHLIGQHGFYEGNGGELRLEPARLAKVLDIRSRDERCRPA